MNPQDSRQDQGGKTLPLVTADNTCHIQGITTGVVTENGEASEEHPGMVKVEIFLGEDNNRTAWVQVVQPYAGSDHGVYWLPEVGDEVVVAFHLGDVNRPYVIGSLWNNNDKTFPQSVSAENTVKRIKTKGGHEIVFEDEKDKERVEIHTPNNLKISLEDEKRMIMLQTKDGRNILQIDGMNGKILVAAENSIAFNATGGRATLELDGQKGEATLSADTIALEPRQKLRIRGEAVLELTSEASMKIESSGVLELKGALIKMN